LTNAAVTYSFGILLQPLKEYFDQDTGLIVFVGSVNIAVTAMTTPLAAIAVKMCGLREVYFIGSILTAAAILVTPFSPTTFVLMLTFGILNGIGLGLNGLVSTVACNYYFEKRLALSTGLNKTGLSIGSFVFPPLSAYVLQAYTWKGVMYLNAGIALLSSIFGCLIIPFQTQKDDNSSRAKKKTKNDENCENNIGGKLLSSIITDEELEQKRTCNIKTKKYVNSNILKLSIVPVLRSLDLSLWKNPSFLLLTACFTLINFGWTVYFMFTPSMLMENLNITSTEASLVLTSTGITNTVCRIIAGILMDHPRINATLLIVVTLLGSGITLTIFPFVQNYWALIILGALFGITCAPYTMGLAIVLRDMIELNQIASAFGKVALIQGIGIIVGPTVSGYIYDVTHDYTVIFVAAGASFIIGGLTCWLSDVIHRKSLVQ
jgi:MFS family permease